jgi:pSer/pThr/pTyr-binding forkhead associated (FHA) protein
MPAGETRKINRPTNASSTQEFFSHNEVTIVMLSGEAVGSEFCLDREEVILGRGPGVDLNFDDPAMSRAHVAFELTGEGFRVRDMASTNGLFLNGTRVQAAELKHGDRLELGEHIFQYIVSEREVAPTYVLTDEAD